MNLQQLLVLALLQQLSRAITIITSREDFLAKIAAGDVEAIKAGFDMRLICSHGPEFLEAASRKGDIAMVRQLLANGAEADRGVILNAAIGSGKKELVVLLVEHGAPLQHVHPKVVEDVVIKGDLGMFGYILEHGYRLTGYSSVLISAVLSRSLEMVKAVMQSTSKFGPEDYLSACQRALQMGSRAIFEHIIASDDRLIDALLEMAVKNLNCFMVKHLDAYITEHGHLHRRRKAYLDLAYKTSSKGRLDIASLLLAHLKPKALRQFLALALTKIDGGHSCAFFTMIMRVKSLPKAIKGSVVTTRSLIASALASSHPEMVRFVLQAASAEGLSACSKAIRTAKKFDFLADLVEQGSAKEALLYDLDETDGLFSATLGRQPDVARKVIQLLDGTAGSSRLLTIAYAGRNHAAVQEILAHSTHIHQAFGHAPLFTQELALAALARNDLEIMKVCSGGFSGDQVLAVLRNLWGFPGIIRKVKLVKSTALLHAVPYASIIAAYEAECAAANPIPELIALLKERLAY